MEPPIEAGDQRDYESSSDTESSLSSVQASFEETSHSSNPTKEVESPHTRHPLLKAQSVETMSIDLGIRKGSMSLRSLKRGFRAMEEMLNQTQPGAQSEHRDQRQKPDVPAPISRYTSFFPPTKLSTGWRPPMALPDRSRKQQVLSLRRGDQDSETGPGTTHEGIGPLKFRRVDLVWDSERYTFELQKTRRDSAKSRCQDSLFDVRRTFDQDGKYRATFVDVKSKLLREGLQDVMKHVNGLCLVDEVPKLDPNMLFLFVDDLRTYAARLHMLDDKRKHLEVLLQYIDTDFRETKEALQPMLQSGLITFDLLWALWKPGTLIYTATYGDHSVPRALKVDLAERHRTMMKGEFYSVEAKYIEYNGTSLGYGHVAEEICQFHGARRISSLPFYPFKYHEAEASLRDELIQRGKQFMALLGVHMKAYSGLAFRKHKKSVHKFHVSDSRIMLDPAEFRRSNPNYLVSLFKPKSCDELALDSVPEASNPCCKREASQQICEKTAEKKEGAHMCQLHGAGKVEPSAEGRTEMLLGTMSREETIGNNDGLVDAFDDTKPGKVPFEGERSMPDAPKSDRESVDTAQAGWNTGVTPISAAGPDIAKPTAESSLLCDEHCLIASPVILGFSFLEKQWLEFDVSGVRDVQWNADAWRSLVLEQGTKELIKAQVESRSSNNGNAADDIIHGKGNGLVVVLHGPPGTGKTLTAEGIGELLRRPLYMASAGDLSTDPHQLESEVRKIMDICHAWGAILLIDEADVYLEKRSIQDIHRNALVSIFLRQLEYFQGILFLTTNRVETFDEAFKSRIHIALRYDKLKSEAKRTVFKLFIDRIRTRADVNPFTEDDIATLASHDLNGREIKNVMVSAQRLAISKKEALGMPHVKFVLCVHTKFQRDLMGGSGFEDAMRSYC